MFDSIILKADVVSSFLLYISKNIEDRIVGHNPPDMEILL